MEQQNDIRSIMELVAKGVITPEEAEKMINEINKKDSFSYQAKEQARTFGEKVGDGIDKVVPKTKSVLKNCFDSAAEFNQKIANKLDEEKNDVKNATTEFNQKVSSEFEEDKQAVKDTTTEFNQKVSSEFEEDKQAIKDTTTEFNQKVSTKFEEGKKAVDEDLDKVFKKDEQEYVNENPDFPDLKEIEQIFEDAGDEVEPTSEEVIDIITNTEDVVQDTIEDIIDLEKDEVK